MRALRSGASVHAPTMDCSRGDSSWYRLRPSRDLATEAAFYRGGFVERIVRSARLEEYPFRRALEKPHPLLFGQIVVREHRRAVSQVYPLLFFSLLSACSPPGATSPSNGVPFLDQLIRALRLCPVLPAQEGQLTPIVRHRN